MINITPTKSIAAIHDLSSYGRCALTVVIPTLSAMGYQVVPLPTAILSTHTGGFRGFSFLELTQQMGEAARHWSKLGIKFDAIYSGFLGSESQTDIVAAFVKHFKEPNTLVLIDPVMGDNGTPYVTITDGIRDKMKKLISKADIITPNVTEAFFLLNLPYRPLNAQLLDELFERLSKIGPKKIVITGVELESGSIGTASLDIDNKNKIIYQHKQIPRSYPGTGDIFASVLLGKLLEKAPLDLASQYASDFVYEVMEETNKYNSPERNGVLLEKNLYRLIPYETIQNKKEGL